MNILQKIKHLLICLITVALMGTGAAVSHAGGGDLDSIRERGFIRHLGVPYANFVTGAGDGFSVELVQDFAAHLGVAYRFEATSWAKAIGQLTGKKFSVKDGKSTVTGETEITGDLIGNGLTELGWRKQLLDYSDPTFQTQVWLLSSAQSSLQPITPNNDIDKDIAAVKEKLSGISVLGMTGTCVDPELYYIKNHDADVVLYEGNLNELAPAVMNGLADSTLLDVPDSLVALQKWPTAFKVIGPVSHVQNMGIGFRKESPELKKEFNLFLQQYRKSGKYLALVKKYYPTALYYFEDFFKK